MKKILLVSPPYEGKSYLKSRRPFPLGLLYIAAYLKKKGIKSEVWDFSYPANKLKTNRPKQLKTGQPNFWRWGWSNNEITQWLKNNLKKYHNVIGITSYMSSNWTGAYKTIELIKDIAPKSIIVIGGPHATVFPEHVAKYSLADQICIGEGEESFYSFLKEIPNSGIVRSKAYKQAKRTSIKNLDLLPFPDRNLLKDQRETKELYVTFSRGCPQKCSFCGSHLIQGRRWRYKNIDRVIEEIKFYHDEWGAQKFIMEDDNPCPGKKGIKHLKTICKKVISELPKAKLLVSHGLPVSALADKELCSLLWESGFRRMSFPVESTDPKVLKDMNKEQVLANWKVAVKNWSKYEKHIPIQVIFGYPFIQTIKTMLQTMMDIAEMHGRVWASWFRANPSIKLFDRCIEAGFIPKDYDPINSGAFYIETPRFTVKDLKEIMQIGQGVNFTTSYECNPFKEILDCKYFFDFAGPIKEGDVIAKGSFKFRKGQNIAAGIMLTATGKFNGRPMVTFNESNDALVYKGTKPSRVYDELKQMLTGKKIKNIRNII